MAGKILTTPAVVLRRYPLGESDRILVLYTKEHGLLRAVAKGARKSKKRYGGILDLLYHLEVELTRRKSPLLLLGHARLVDAYRPLSLELMRLAAGCYLAEVAASFAAEDQPEPETFNALTCSLRGLCNGKDAGALSRLVELRTLDHAGLAPRLDICTVTGRVLREDETTAFEPHRGGTVCLNKALPHSPRLAPETRRAMRRVLECPLPEALRIEWTREQSVEARAAMQAMITYHTSRPLYSRAFAEAAARYLRERKKASGEVQ